LSASLETASKGLSIVQAGENKIIDILWQSWRSIVWSILRVHCIAGAEDALSTVDVQS
jgi:hypothetical protein